MSDASTLHSGGDGSASEPVDLRSDTVTRPTAAMRATMASAVVGDDGFRDDPTVRALEERVATMLAKEAALFVPSGTMANQVALRLHTSPGDEAIAHSRCHIFDHEAGGAAALAGVSLRMFDSDDGSLDPRLVEAHLHLEEGTSWAPTRLVCMENTHNACGGTVLPVDNVEQICAIARRHGLGLHLDGARLFNAAQASGTTVAALAEPFDTVSVCMSKGLGAPIGSLLVGSEAAMLRGRRLRKMLGGMMRQVGIIAAGALYALDHHLERLADDHRRAAMLAEGIADIAGIDVATPQTNIVYFEVSADHPALLAASGESIDAIDRLAAAGVLVSEGPRRLRAVLHLGVDDVGVERAIAAIVQVFGDG